MASKSPKYLKVLRKCLHRQAKHFAKVSMLQSCAFDSRRFLHKKYMKYNITFTLNGEAGSHQTEAQNETDALGMFSADAAFRGADNVVVTEVPEVAEATPATEVTPVVTPEVTQPLA